MNNRLKTCPHCESNAVSGQAVGEEGGRFFVQTGCGSCGALGPKVEIPECLVERIANLPAELRAATPLADAAWNCRGHEIPPEMQLLG